MTGHVPAQAPFPGNFKQTLISRHRIIQKIRDFFNLSDYIEVETPLRVRCPGIDPYIDSLSSENDFFLATSPELQMKRLLGLDIDRIYQITHAFRAEEEGSLHSTEFTMLEWYRIRTSYLDIMQETECLIKFIVEEVECTTTSVELPFERIQVDELFKKTAGWEPTKHWDEDKYFNDWVERIDPFINTLGWFFLVDFPAPLAALSRIKKDNPLVCERFELFMGSMEIGNAFTELTDYNEHMIRFDKSGEKRTQLGKEPYPIDEGFIKDLKSGFPECSGIAVGIDRLVMALLGISNIDQVQTFPMSRL